jgi:hypothetical protein
MSTARKNIYYTSIKISIIKVVEEQLYDPLQKRHTSIRKYGNNK